MIHRTTEEVPTPDGYELNTYSYVTCDECGAETGEFVYNLDGVAFCRDCFEDDKLNEVMIILDEEGEGRTCDECGAPEYQLYGEKELICRDCIDKRFRWLDYQYIDYYSDDQ